MHCKNCGYYNMNSKGNCVNCDYPLDNNSDNIKSYKLNLRIIKASYMFFNKHFFKNLLLLALLFLIAASVMLYQLIYKNNNNTILPIALFVFISAFYFLIYLLGKKTDEYYYLSQFTMVFYLIHSIIEFSLQLYPSSIDSSSNLIAKTGIDSFISVYLPFFYLGLRIAIIYFFLRSLVMASKLKKNKKLFQYCLISNKI